MGSQPASFGIQGVEQYTFPLRKIADARAIRHRIVECFERAASPFSTQEEKIRLLHFAVVGGGPVSVEFAAELHDFVKSDVSKLYP